MAVFGFSSTVLVFTGLTAFFMDIIRFLLYLFLRTFSFFFRCVVDPETHIFSQGTHETRFVFSAFEFPQTHNSVYIFCNSTFCKTTDTSDMCTQICHGSPSLMGRSLWTLESEREKKSNYLNVFP